ncbi:MAG: tRNA (5-methylaminomethyl-2-thiouridine)(34)-methyltransferase MnmD [Cyclobacteriaceae bacterium]
MSKPILKIITTEDGSHSLLREDLNETYHSFHGARGESEYVFVKMGLEYLLHEKGKTEIEVFEVGMGTGLNALLTLIFAKAENVKIGYHTIEPIPVTPEIYAQLNYGTDEYAKICLQKIHNAAWEVSVKLTDEFEIVKYKTGLENINITKKFDIIYFDAFAPSKQPEMWALTNIQKCFDLLKPGGILTTYCAQGQFKRNLKAAGFEIESLPGAMGKKEMVRAIKP